MGFAEEAFKVWLRETMAKALKAGGTTALDEVLETLTIDQLTFLKRTIDRIHTKRTKTVDAEGAK